MAFRVLFKIFYRLNVDLWLRLLALGLLAAVLSERVFGLDRGTFMLIVLLLWFCGWVLSGSHLKLNFSWVQNLPMSRRTLFGLIFALGVANTLAGLVCVAAWIFLFLRLSSGEFFPVFNHHVTVFHIWVVRTLGLFGLALLTVNCFARGPRLDGKFITELLWNSEKRSLRGMKRTLVASFVASVIYCVFLSDEKYISLGFLLVLLSVSGVPWLMAVRIGMSRRARTSVLAVGVSFMGLMIFLAALLSNAALKRSSNLDALEIHMRLDPWMTGETQTILARELEQPLEPDLLENAIMIYEARYQSSTRLDLKSDHVIRLERILAAQTDSRAMTVLGREIRWRSAGIREVQAWLELCRRTNGGHVQRCHLRDLVTAQLTTADRKNLLESGDPLSIRLAMASASWKQDRHFADVLGRKLSDLDQGERKIAQRTLASVNEEDSNAQSVCYGKRKSREKCRHLVDEINQDLNW